jgi:hypothetical protein
VVIRSRFLKVFRVFEQLTATQFLDCSEGAYVHLLISTILRHVHEIEGHLNKQIQAFPILLKLVSPSMKQNLMLVHCYLTTKTKQAKHRAAADEII